MVDWDAGQYLKFEQERSRPARDLAAQIPLKEPAAILDLGCGPGNSTEILAGRFPKAHVAGADCSEAMLRAARDRCPNLEFFFLDAAHPESLVQLKRQFDLVFSNACLQWVPDHPRLLPRLMDLLAPGGVLAVQMPQQRKAAFHQVLSRQLAESEWRERFPDQREISVLSPQEYGDLLAPISSDFSIWETRYFHRLPSHRAILEWYRGSALRPYLSKLAPTEQSAFEKELLDKIEQAYPFQKNGEVLLPFPRLFFVAMV